MVVVNFERSCQNLLKAIFSLSLPFRGNRAVARESQLLDFLQRRQVEEVMMKLSGLKSSFYVLNRGDTFTSGFSLKIWKYQQLQRSDGEAEWSRVPLSKFLAKYPEQRGHTCKCFFSLKTNWKCCLGWNVKSPPLKVANGPEQRCTSFFFWSFLINWKISKQTRSFGEAEWSRVSLFKVVQASIFFGKSRKSSEQMSRREVSSHIWICILTSFINHGAKYSQIWNCQNRRVEKLRRAGLVP